MVTRETTMGAPGSARTLLDGFSLEMTGKDGEALTHAAGAGVIPTRTQINVTDLATEDRATQLSAAATVRELGLTPVPHISARRLPSQSALREHLDGLRLVDASRSVFVVGGDARQPAGPFADALSVIRSGVLEQFGVGSVGIAGYPGGHPDIADDVLWRALQEKSTELTARGLTGSIITQFSFDAGLVLEWVEQVRRREILIPMRIGVPGPAGVRRLLAYARRFGVATSTEVVRKYGFSLTNLLGTAGPDRFVSALAQGYDPARHGEVELHLYAFGGLRETAEWVDRFRADPLAR